MDCSDPAHRCSGNLGLYRQRAGDHFDIYFCDSFRNSSHTDLLCKESGVNFLSPRGSQVFRVLAYALLPNMDEPGKECIRSMGIPGVKAIRNPDAYAVITQILCCLRRVRVLTRGRDLCSASLPRSTTMAVVNDENIGGRSFKYCVRVWIAVLPLRLG